MTNLPAEFLRPDVLLCAGEDSLDCPIRPAEFAYRGFTARLEQDTLVMTTPFGSSSMEALIWELLRPGVVKRIVMAGTAGSLAGYDGPTMAPVAVVTARSAYQAFEGHEKASWNPSWNLGLTPVESVSTDRFYGFSNLTDGDYPAEPGLQETWAQLGKSNAIVEMEVAPFYYFCQAFGAPDLQYAAIKVVANQVSDLDSLPAHAAGAMRVAVHAAWTALQA